MKGAGPTGEPGRPLAEGRWFWRRLYVFASSAALWVLLARVGDMIPPEAAPRLAEALMGLLALTMVLYLVAPTAQELIAGLRLLHGRSAREVVGRKETPGRSGRSRPRRADPG
ncbi:hypothetical protein [Brevundimonas sp. FT23028]|uniref:hypothetical protein n=1 Tax=Brevundimonas sp. FT23028 TaxID=3393748 RepID=UPI003B585C20